MTPTGQPLRILVVDDDPAIREMLAAVLADEGYAVETAGDGDEALAEFEARRPDLTVLDLMMPGMDGFTLYRELEARTASRPPVIVVTALHVTESTRRAFPATAPILKKPFDLEELLQRVAELASGERS